jgi:hypothetical protein
MRTLKVRSSSAHRSASRGTLWEGRVARIWGTRWLLATLLVQGCQPGPSPMNVQPPNLGAESSKTAYFVFVQESPEGKMREFIFKLNEAKIKQARAIIADPNSRQRHVEGTIVVGRVPYNPDWSFHLDPTTVSFFELAVEVCDANATYVEAHLSEIGGATLPNKFWCPWSSKLSREVKSTGL